MNITTKSIHMNFSAICVMLLNVATTSAQSLPFVVVNATTGNMNIRSSNCTSGTVATTLAYGSKLVASSLTSANCGYEWYKVDVPATSAPSGSFYGAKDVNAFIPDATTAYVEVLNTGSAGLLVRPGAGTGTGNVTIGSSNAKIWDGQKLAVTGSTQAVSGYTWYQIHLTQNCSQVTGWVSGQYLTFHPGQAATGSVSVTLAPSEAVSAGARWSFDGGSWQTSGATLSDISPGSYTIGFKTVSGWNSPASQSLTVTASATVAATGVYTQTTQTGSVKVTVSPAEAISAGALWRLDGAGSWRQSGYTLSNVAVGSHVVNFYAVPDWTAPASLNVNVSTGQTANASGTYVQNLTPTVVISSPNGGENLLFGEATVISGTATGISSIQLAYSIDGGQSYQEIGSVNSIGGYFSYNWTVPPTPSTQCKVRVTASSANGTIQDVSNENFSITPQCYAVDPDASTYSDYPFKEPNNLCKTSANNQCESDDWGFCRYNCTSWVAWKINQLAGAPRFKNLAVFDKPVILSDAKYWRSAIEGIPSKPYDVNDQPAIGSIAFWPQGSAGLEPGHVAFVTCVSGSQNEFVTLTEFNFLKPCEYGMRVVNRVSAYAAGNRFPAAYIHIESGGYGGGTSVENAAKDLKGHSLNVGLGASPGHIQVSIDGLKGAWAQLRVTDILGHELYSSDQKSISEGRYSGEIDVGGVGKGMVIVTLTTDVSTTSKAILVP